MEIQQENGLKERRCHTRFPLRECDAIATLGPKPLTIGKMLDISETGLSVEFIPPLQQKDVLPTEIDIYLIGKHFLLQGLTCRCVYVENAERPHFSMVQSKRCGLEFKTPEALQFDQLKSLIQFA